MLGRSVGLRTINERINQIEPLLQQARSEPIVDVPAVVQFDGIWLREQTQTDTIKLDKRGRKRKKRKGKKVVLLVALGLWADGSGKREILDWQVADGESKAAWEPFVHRLWERGLRPENGLQAVLEQRCIFHKLRNVADKCREELKGDANKETRKQLMEQASVIYQAESAEEARQRLTAFAEQWRARTHKAVATLERDFEQTIAFYTLDGVARELIRTTSLLERTNRELRRKFRQVCCFGSLTGAEVAIYLQVKRLNARWSKQTWWDTAHSLYFAFLNPNP